MSDKTSNVTVSWGFGWIIGCLLSWHKFHSILSLIWPILFGWIYVVYHLCKFYL